MLVPAESYRCSMAPACAGSPREQVFEPHAHGGLVPPAMAAVVAIEEQARVFLLRHRPSGRALEFEHLGLALGDERLEDSEGGYG
jgi:hypothetical protein